MIVVAILGVLAAISYASFRTVPRAAKVASAVMEMTGELQSAKGQASARTTRMIVLLYSAPNEPIRYWTLLDPNLTVDDLMQALPSWKKPEELLALIPPPAPPPGEQVRVVNKGTLDPVITLLAGGYRTVVNNVQDTRCVAYGTSAFTVAAGNAGFSGYFPPPYCMVPDNAPCTFCTSAPDGVRGAIAFEPDGRVRLLGANGVETPAGAGSISFSAPDLPAKKGVSIAITSAGLMRTFRGPK